MYICMYIYTYIIYIYTVYIYMYTYQSDLPRFGGSGTGTALGDPIEVGALRGVMQEGVAGWPGGRDLKCLTLRPMPCFGYPLVN